MGNCVETIPRLTPSEGYCMLLCCIFFGGFGTLYTACLGDCNCCQIMIGIFQIIIPGVGYIWALIWGYLIYYKSKEALSVAPHTQRTSDHNYTNTAPVYIINPQVQ